MEQRISHKKLHVTALSRMEWIKKLGPVIQVGPMAAMSSHVLPFLPASRNGNECEVKNLECAEEDD
jgi:hypothetical protein